MKKIKVYNILQIQKLTQKLFIFNKIKKKRME